MEYEDSRVTRSQRADLAGCDMLSVDGSRCHSAALNGLRHRDESEVPSNGTDRQQWLGDGTEAVENGVERFGSYRYLCEANSRGTKCRWAVLRQSLHYL
jgi:hypothetical protein